MNPFPGQFTILRPETWPAGIAAGKYAGQPLKASCAEGLAPLLCALSPTSRIYLSQGLSIRVTLFEGRNIKLTVVSTQTAHFVDRSLNLVLASTEIPVFMDKTANPIHHNRTSHG